jgi:hypothetical protein
MIGKSGEGAAHSEAAAEGARSGAEPSRGLKKGPWTAAEDSILVEYVKTYGEGNWNAVQKNCGLMRCGKSCRLRWANHLRPNLKKGTFSPEEERIIIELHAKLGNKWARMASQVYICPTHESSTIFHDIYIYIYIYIQKNMHSHIVIFMHVLLICYMLVMYFYYRGFDFQTLFLLLYIFDFFFIMTLLCMFSNHSDAPRHYFFEFPYEYSRFQNLI